MQVIKLLLMILDWRTQAESDFWDIERHIGSTTQASIIKPGSRIFNKHFLSINIPLVLLDNDIDRVTENCLKKVMAIYNLRKNKLLSK